jgi:hypothetical protein
MLHIHKLGPLLLKSRSPSPTRFPPCIMPILQSVDGTNQRHVAGGVSGLVEGAVPRVD